MNVLIFPTDDRSGQASLIYHYSSLGHRVFIPKFGTLGLNWSRIATWPALLYKASSDLTKRNLDIHGFDRTDVLFGEDYFLKDMFAVKTLYSQQVSCEIIDLETENPGIDVFHTLRGAEAYLKLYFEIAKQHFPNAKWVSSTFNQMTSTPGNYQPKNAAKFIPAPYEEHHQNINNVCIMALDFESELLGADIKSTTRKGFASFNHNFSNRQPVDYKLFQEMNALLKRDNFDEVPNFGGNIRTQGADIRYTEQNGITGQFKTINPASAYELTARLTAAVHFKETDWGGGVFYYCLNTGTPIITTERYVNASNSKKYLIDQLNAVYVNTPEAAAAAVQKLTTDFSYASSLQVGMQAMKLELFDNNYWENWKTFLASLT